MMMNEVMGRMVLMDIEQYHQQHLLSTYYLCVRQFHLFYLILMIILFSKHSHSQSPGEEMRIREVL